RESESHIRGMRSSDVLQKALPDVWKTICRNCWYGNILKGGIEGGGQFLHHCPFVCLGRVQLQTELAEANLHKTIVYDLKCRHLFRHEEHRFPSGKCLGDQIRNRL